MIKESLSLQNEDNLRSLWDIKCGNICIIEVPEGEGREEGFENLFQEIIIENFPNVVKEIKIQLQESES